MNKSNMLGAYDIYRQMFKQIMWWDLSPKETGNTYFKNDTHKVLGNEDNHYLYALGWSMSDMGYHGWSGSAAENERNIYNKVETAYFYLLKSLAEAIGFEYTDEDIWKYRLKDIDTDDMLKLYEANKQKKG
jgi:hypothetical protein